MLDYAEQLTGDRQAANTELAGIAAADGYHSASPLRPTLSHPATARPAGDNDVNDARKLAGAYTPVAYFAGEVKADREAVDLYQSESQSAGNSALRSYARNFLPKMRGELATAEHLLHVEMS
ncbi:MAG TPA: DUF4142 domain-containing protein, partial [Candidatus Tumulicola sp.]|nr:DUF4142 domain-containing protein [Candidatus Tumulicola sp.]